MKISGKTPTAPQGAEASKLGRSGAAADKKGASAAASSLADLAGSSKVEVSDRARDVAKARALATPDDSIDEAKVARLQKMIDDGKYKVDADAIAERLLDEHMKMPIA